MPMYTLNIRKEDEEVWKAFDEICRRENDDKSKIIREKIAEYVKAHKEGNNTFKLEKWVENSTFVGLPSFGEILKHDYLDSLSEEDFNLLVEKATARTQEISAAIKRRDPMLLHITGPEQSRGYK